MREKLLRSSERLSELDNVCVVGINMEDIPDGSYHSMDAPSTSKQYMQSVELTRDQIGESNDDVEISYEKNKKKGPLILHKATVHPSDKSNVSDDMWSTADQMIKRKRRNTTGSIHRSSLSDEPLRKSYLKQLQLKMNTKTGTSKNKSSPPIVSMQPSNMQQNEPTSASSSPANSPNIVTPTTSNSNTPKMNTPNLDIPTIISPSLSPTSPPMVPVNNNVFFPITTNYNPNSGNTDRPSTMIQSADDSIVPTSLVELSPNIQESHSDYSIHGIVNPLTSTIDPYTQQTTPRVVSQDLEQYMYDINSTERLVPKKKKSGKLAEPMVIADVPQNYTEYTNKPSNTNESYVTRINV